MRKNVASQTVGAEMVSASDGSAFTGAVTVFVTGDGGTQATGSVGAGACTSEGNGYHSYAPAQAETNYDHVAFTFTGTGAIPATVQVYTSFPQTGDSFARLGAPAAASVSADILVIDNLVDDLEARLGTPSNLGSGATVAANLVDIEGQTDDIGAAGVGLTAVPWNAAWDAQVESEVNDALVAYDAATGTDVPSAGVIADAVWDEDATAHQTQGTFGQAIGDPVADADTIWSLVNTNLNATVSSRASQTSVDDLPTNAELATALGTADDATLAAIAALPTAAVIADSVWDEDATAHQTQGTFGQAIGDPVADADTIWGLVNTNLNATVSSRATQTSVDDLPTNAELATALDPLPTAAENADAVWDEVLADHLTAGTTGAALNGAGAAGDPWGTALPGAYGAGTAGKIVGDNINAPISDLPTNAELATALGTADDAVLTAIDALPTNAELATALAAADDAVLAAIDALPTATENADELLKRDFSAVSGEASRSVLNSLRHIRNKFSTTATPGSVTVYKEDDTTPAYTKTITTDPAAEPIVEG